MFADDHHAFHEDAKPEHAVQDTDEEVEVSVQELEVLLSSGHMSARLVCRSGQSRPPDEGEAKTMTMPAQVQRANQRELLQRRIGDSGLSSGQFAVEVLRREPRTIRRWIAGDAPIPHVVLEFLLEPKAARWPVHELASASDESWLASDDGRAARQWAVRFVPAMATALSQDNERGAYLMTQPQHVAAVFKGIVGGEALIQHTVVLVGQAHELLGRQPLDIAGVWSAVRAIARRWRIDHSMQMHENAV